MNLDLFPHKDKVIYNEGNFLILDGIDIEGKSIPDGLLYVLYKNERYFYTTMASKEMYQHDKEFFWSFVRSRVANGICNVRKNEP